MVNKAPDNDSYINYFYSAFQSVSEGISQQLGNKSMTEVATDVFLVGTSSLFRNTTVGYLYNSAVGIYSLGQDYKKVEEKRSANAHFIRELKRDQEAKLAN